MFWLVLVATLGLSYLVFSKGLLPKPLGRFAGYLFNWPTIPLITFLNTFIPKRFPSDVDETLILGNPLLILNKGPQPAYWEVKTLAKRNVSGVINMCDEYAGPVRTYREMGIVQLQLPTVDHTEPEVSDILQAIRFIEQHKANGSRVYLHCRAGRGRS